MAELVVGGALLGILQGFVGFVQFLEAALGFFVASVAVGMAFLGEAAIGGFDFLIGGAPLDAKNFVIIALGHGCAVL